MWCTLSSDLLGFVKHEGENRDLLCRYLDFFCCILPLVRDPRRTSSKVDYEVQGLNGVTGFIPLMENVLANLRLRVNIFDHLETKKKAVNLVLKKRKEEKKSNWHSFDEIRLVFSYSGNGCVEIIRTIPFYSDALFNWEGLWHYFLRAACLLSCGGRVVGNVRVVINASKILCEVEIVDFYIVIKLHQLLKFIKPEVYMESMYQWITGMNMFT